MILTQTDPQRREYYRIDDTVMLSYRLSEHTDPEQGLQAMQEEADPRYTLMADFTALSDYIHRQLTGASRGQVEFVRSIKTLDEKINRLARLVAEEGFRRGEERIAPVNLSAGGVSFVSDEPVSSGALLDIRVVLRPALYAVLAIAEVIDCESRDDGQLVRTKYVAIRDSDRDLLVRHIMSKESHRIRVAADQDPNLGG